MLFVQTAKWMWLASMCSSLFKTASLFLERIRPGWHGCLIWRKHALNVKNEFHCSLLPPHYRLYNILYKFSSTVRLNLPQRKRRQSTHMVPSATVAELRQKRLIFDLIFCFCFSPVSSRGPRKRSFFLTAVSELSVSGLSRCRTEGRLHK